MALEAVSHPRQGHLMRFRGVAHPTGEADGYDGLFLTKAQIEARARDIVGTPIWYEHDGAKKVGWVVDGSSNENDQLVIDAVIDRRLFAGALAARAMQSGKLKGLSLGITAAVLEDPKTGISRVLNKAIKEVSITSVPDLADTFISDIAPDSKTFENARKSAAVNLENRKTKSARDKKQNALSETSKQLGAFLRSQKELAQINFANIKEVDSSLPLTPGIEMSAQQQQGAIPASAAAAAAPAPAPAPVGDLTEIGALTRKLEQMAADQLQMQKLLAEKDELIKIVGAAPDKVAALLAREQQEQEQLRQKMIDGEEALLDKLAADMVAAGHNPDDHPDIFASIRNGKNNPGAYAPLHLVMTTAGAASAQRATEAETRYQMKNAEAARLVQEKSELQERLKEADVMRIQMEAQFKSQAELQQRADKYKGLMLPSAGPKSAYAYAPTPAPAAAAPTPTPTPAYAAATAAYAPDDAESHRPMKRPRDSSNDNVAVFGVGGRAPPNLELRAVAVPTINSAPEGALLSLFGDAGGQTRERLLSMFESRQGQTGMSTFNIPRLVGKEYAPLASGAWADGGLDMSGVNGEIRSARPPVPFSNEVKYGQ